MRKVHEGEQADIAAWLADQPGVSAVRTSSFVPEQWEGEVDGHSFYFRERHGEWRLEIDLQPTGRYANRLVEVGPDGEMVTEPVPLTEGTVIARGLDSDLGEGPVAHLAFIVRALRGHLRTRSCGHVGAAAFCPLCGIEMGGPAGF
jgi:hypothetical protein